MCTGALAGGGGVLWGFSLSNLVQHNLHYLFHFLLFVKEVVLRLNPVKSVLLGHGGRLPFFNG